MNESQPSPIRFLVPQAVLLAVLFVGGLSWNTLARAASPPELAATYGRGVHAFFAHQSKSAEQHFSQVIQSGSTDPRVYYFRAMTRLRSGRQHEAEEDMRIGAAYEARNPGVRHAIGKALERVQGPHRRLLEQVRRQARLDRMQQRQQQTRQRYEQLRQRESEVLRSEVKVPLEQLLEPSMQSPAQVGVPSRLAVEASPPSPQQPAITPGPEPTETIDDDLFGAPDEMSDEELFDDTPEPAAEDDFFGEVPSEESSDENSDDPFGETGPEEQPVDSEEDLFGEPVPTEEATDEEEDPFATFQPDDVPSASKTDSFVGAQPDADGSELSDLKSEDKVSPGKLMGILGRVVGSTLPWHGLEMPAIGISQDNGDNFSQVQTVGELEFGPMDEDSQTMHASAELPVDSSEPIAESALERAVEAGQAELETDSSEEPEDDPFGDF